VPRRFDAPRSAPPNGTLPEEQHAAARAATERRRRLRTLAGVLAVAALLVAVLVAFGGFRRDPAERGSTTTVAGRTVRGVSETAALLRGLPQHGPTLGDPRAPVTIVVVSDLKCPHCQRHALTTQREIVDRLVRSGRARLTLHLVNQRDAARGTTDGEDARRAAYSLVAKDRFWSFVQTSFWNQGPTDRAWATAPFLRAIAAAAPGVDPADLVVGPSPASAAAISAADRLSRRLGTDETPSIYVAARGSRELRRITAIDDLDAIERAVDAATPRGR
jgi:protein-disulfide isomerase